MRIKERLTILEDEFLECKNIPILGVPKELGDVMTSYGVDVIVCCVTYVYDSYVLRLHHNNFDQFVL